ncbi:hypothetical protein F511_34489 [Dorcoceras hygrometricum]|uniref:Bidirectional sugar transporter SWEET n=1 Tax=Dorcoceras hygrometricum TaxID=472368 RepID=A0A2Z7B7J1_9LAMI|nr:hypothetical protein F511_34489 [Dorcoceras hygrometricum]
MAAFGDHHPSPITFGILGNIVSILVYFAPFPTFVRIYKEKSTLGFQSVPYNVAFFSAALWLYYALLKHNAPLLVSINTIGCVIETCYIVTYLYFASRKSRFETARLFCLLNLVAFPIIFALTFFIFEDAELVQVVGWVCVAVSIGVFAAPLSIAFEVVRTRSVEFMPFPLSFCLTVSAVMWFAYGLLKRDLCVALPNVIGFFLGMLQMVLYGLFRKPPRPQAVVVVDVVNNNNNNEDKFPEHVLSIIILGTPQVHPTNSENGGDGTVHVENTNDEPHASSVEASPVNLRKDAAAFEVHAA